MTIQFGLELEEKYFPNSIQTPEPIEHFFGVHGLLHYLEKHLGISYPERNDYLRQEQYRQALFVHLTTNPDAFYARSFQADAIATANTLLAYRDELLLADWDFSIEEGMPIRLQTLATIEQQLQQGIPTHLYDGFAERFCKMKYWLTRLPIPLERIYLTEPRDLLPFYLQDLWEILETIGVEIVEATTPDLAKENTDLRNFQQALLKQDYEKGKIRADGSIVILKGKREVYLAEYIAKIFAQNRAYQPVCLIPNKNRALDNSLVEEGLPSFGILSASLARPTLQILKLVSTFLWRPINPYKILEFVSLPVTPIHSKLAKKIAKVMAEKPGLNSGSWRRMVAEFFGYYEEEIERNPERRLELEKEERETRLQFNKWFNRRRYDTKKAVPKAEVIDLFDGIWVWADTQIEEVKKELDKIQKRIENPATPHQDLEKLADKKEDLTKRQQALNSLFEQARKLIQILETLPEADSFLSYLRLERLVRTINEPAAMRFRKTEVGHLPFVYHNSAITRPVEDVFWWNFVDNTVSIGFSNWYPTEQQYLTQRSISYTTTQQKNNLLLWQRVQPILQCQKRLVLVWPQYIEGKEQLSHPLWGDLCAALDEDKLVNITVDVDEQHNIEFLEQFLKVPDLKVLSPVELGKPQPYLKIPYHDTLPSRDRESFTSLSNLLYYPYQWFFRYQADFNRSSILSISKENRLKGNLAHQLFEQLFNTIIENKNAPWTKTETYDWVADYMPGLLEREGAVLLMYGYEPERLGFIQTLQYAAWSLIQMIQDNNWKVVATEHLVEGKLLDQNLYGYIDVVLERKGEKAIIDLKWQGANSRKMSYKNREDLQLVIYSKLLDNTTEWAHTAYFIMKDAKMIARNNLAFAEAETPSEEEYTFQEIHQTIWDKIEKTYIWRMQQITAGHIEVRTKETMDDLEDEEREEAMNTGQFMDLLEMKRDNARYDDYTVLINLVE